MLIKNSLRKIITITSLAVFSVSFLLLKPFISLAAVDDVQLGWVKTVGGTGQDYAWMLAGDSNGNTYTVGSFSGTVDFDPGPGTVNLTAVGGTDIFIMKFNSNGDFVWAKGMGGSGADEPYAVAIDSSGNVYTTGYFSNTVDFDPGAGVYNLTSAGGTDIFISKLDTDGNFVFAKRIGDAGADSARGILAEGGNIYLTGSFSGTTDFDPGAGVFNLVSNGGSDIFVSKFDSSGNLIWVKQIGSNGDDSGFSITADETGNVYTTGFFSNTADFDPGAGVYNLTSAGLYDIYLSKLDSSGNFVWSYSFGSTSNDVGRYLKFYGGSIYTTGGFAGTVDFDFGAGVFNLTPNGGGDIYILKVNEDGTFSWAGSFGGGYADISGGIWVNSSGVYLTGAVTSGVIDVDPGPGVFNLTAVGNDVYAIKLTLGGNFVWAKQMGGTLHDVGYGIVTDANGNVYVSGLFNGTADLDPGTGTLNITSAGGKDIFLEKLVPVDTTPDAFSFSSQTGLSFNTATESNSITISGINNAAPISIGSCSAGTCEYSVNGASYTSSSGTVVNGDTVKVRQTSSSSYNNTRTLVLNIGDVLGSFSITTIPDTTPPVLTIFGDNPININSGSNFIDPGATATDDNDGNLTTSVTSTGTVDTNTPGTYTITYHVSDQAGNAATPITRTVVVTSSGPSISPISYQTPSQLIINDQLTSNTSSTPGGSASLSTPIFTINDNLPFTTSNPLVTLRFNNFNNPLITKLAISTSTDFTASSLMSYTPTYSYNLCGTNTTANCPNGLYTIYARYYTDYGQSTLAGPLNINLDRGASSATVLLPKDTVSPISTSTAPVLSSNPSSSLASRLSGRILLQVQDKGQAWYVNPTDSKRYSLGSPDNAFSLMRELALGISNDTFNSFKNNTAPKRLSGRILLNVDNSGKAYYVSPANLRLYYLGRPADAFSVMRTLGLGVTNEDLDRIKSGY